MVDAAVVTGAAQGIGREITRLLAARGFVVLATDIDGAAAEAVAAELDGGARGMALDVRDPQAHRDAAAAAAALGRVTVWVNCAGVLWAAKAWEHDDAQVRMTLEVNTLGVIHGCRAAVSVMDSGDIVNLASLSAFPPSPGLAVYAASKAAVTSFTTSLAGDLAVARIPVRVHALCPDTVDTPMVAAVRDNDEAYLQFTAPRLLTAREVAQAAVALIGSRTMVRSLPAHRGVIARVAGLSPRLMLPALGVVRARGTARRLAR